MHVLMTADTVGGVWTYTRELVSGLIEQGIRVSLVSLGKLPSPNQTTWMDALPELDYRPTDYRLEWMQDSERDVEESSNYLESVIREVRPDLLHLNQYCYGTVSPEIPRIVVAHSDVVSWWVAVHGHEPKETPWIRWYRDTVTSGLGCADVVIAPSQWMLDVLRTYYTRPSFGVVVHNGCNPARFDPDLPKKDFVLSVGRLWDKAKQVSLLLQRDQAIPVCIAGSGEEPGREATCEDGPKSKNPKLKGSQSSEQLRCMFAEASVYAATSCYEPFGLAALEAAFSRCALVANDIPTFHELWGDSACYFRHNDPDDLAATITALSRDEEMRSTYAEAAFETARAKVTAEKMIAQYTALYQTVTSAEAVA
ncbi:MAG: glycosyl transferase family 1 [Acidobacteria bacterium]|nr:MAG: glycosyl transferase family 1 [Acidobacteriota bacterium]